MAEAKTPAKKSGSEAAQVGRFGLVGIMSFVIDITLFNIFIRLFINGDTLYFGLLRGVALASVLSGSIAMVNSFIFNQRFTFKSKKTDPGRIVLFFVITAFGIYVLRPLIINFFTRTWLWPADTAYNISSALHLPFSTTFVTNNTGLMAAILIVLVYNYLMYKKFIFKK